MANNVHQLCLTYHPKQANPARAGGLGVWRVRGALRFIAGMPPVEVFSDQMHRKSLRVLTTKLYKPRSRVDPARLVRDFSGVV